MRKKLFLSAALFLGACSQMPIHRGSSEESSTVGFLEDSVPETPAVDEISTELASQITASPAPIAPTTVSSPTQSTTVVKLVPPVDEVAQEQGEDDDDTDADEEDAAPLASSLHEGLILYEMGRREFASKKYDAAISQFRRFLDMYPEHVYSDRAQFWILESFWSSGDLSLALAEAQKFERQYPYSFRLPEVVFRRGGIYESLGQRQAAAKAWQEVLRRFPAEPVARDASRRLAQLSSKRSEDEATPQLMPIQ